MESAETHLASPAILMRNVSVGSLQDPLATILTGVNWEVSVGDFWVVAGLQGEGKSDLLMMTAGLMPPLDGQYLLFDEPMPMFEEARLPHRLRLGLAFETGQLFNQLTVAENLALPLRYHRNLSKADAFATVQAMLDALELGPWADSTPGALGRNWQKRVGLARALMLKPDVLLIDNPLSGLDLRHVVWWLNFLEQLSKGHNFLREDPITMIVTTADFRTWTGVGQNFAIVRNNQFRVLGDRAQLDAASKEIAGDLLGPEIAQ